MEFHFFRTFCPTGFEKLFAALFNDTLLNRTGYGYCTFHLSQFSFDLYLTFSSLNENYKLKKLLAKVEKVLTFLSLAFFKLT